MMKKCVSAVLSVIIVSFFFFPFEFISLPGMNTKKAMAGLGIVILFIQLAMKKQGVMNKDLFLLALTAMGVSLMSIISVVYNHTNDYFLVSYFVSMCVWMAGAYTASFWLKRVHGYLSVELIANYLIWVCVMQCVLALAMDLYVPLKQFVDSFVGGQGFMGKAEGRLYGIGCALDVAGLRFSAILVMIAHLCVNAHQAMTQKRMGWYIAAFFIISVIGNMISRTTTIGCILALLYWCYAGGLIKYNFIKWFGGISLVAMPVLFYLYHNNQAIHEHIRFAFEGFFSLLETGKWEVSSNDILLDHMLIFPDTIKTWLIGDGYASNPTDIHSEFFDPTYTGEIYHGFYKGTDIGYLRYIFYFGLTGLAVLMAFFGKATHICMTRFRTYRVMFLMLLILNLLGWIKVSSDIFSVFALFLIQSEAKHGEYGERIALKK